MLGPQHPYALISRGYLVLLQGHKGDAAVTVRAVEAVQAEMVAILGDDNPSILVGRGHLALWRARAGDRSAAVRELETLVADLGRVLGPEHPYVTMARRQLAAVAIGKAETPPAPGDPWTASDLYLRPIAAS